MAFIEWFHVRLKITGGGDLVTWISPEMQENQGKARTFFDFKYGFTMSYLYDTNGYTIQEGNLHEKINEQNQSIDI